MCEAEQGVDWLDMRVKELFVKIKPNKYEAVLINCKKQRHRDTEITFLFIPGNTSSDTLPAYPPGRQP